jgi:hypothetical protein
LRARNNDWSYFEASKDELRAFGVESNDFGPSASNYQSELSAKFDAGFILVVLVLFSTIHGMFWYHFNNCATEMGTCMAVCAALAPSACLVDGSMKRSRVGTFNRISHLRFRHIYLATNYKNEINLGRGLNASCRLPYSACKVSD